MSDWTEFRKEPYGHEAACSNQENSSEAKNEVREQEKSEEQETKRKSPNIIQKETSEGDVRAHVGDVAQHARLIA
jgi:hypothetical protein